MRVIFYYNKNKSKFVSPPTDWPFDRVISDLTIGREYEAHIDASKNGRYVIMSDRGHMNDYPSGLFTTVEEIREIKLKELGI